MCPAANWLQRRRMPLICCLQSNTFILGLIIAKRPYETDRYAWLSTAASVTTILICYLWIFSVQLHVHLNNWTLKYKLLYLLHHIRCVKWNLQDMLCKHSHIKCETWAQIHSTTAEIHNFFQGVVFYWHTLWVKSPPGDLRVIQLTKFNLEDDH